MVDFEFNALLSAMRSLFHKYPATFILYIHWSKEENLTKKLILQNIIMLLLFVYRSVHICVASAWGWLYTVQVYTAQGWLLARAWPLAPAPPGPESPAPRPASHGLTTQVPSSLARPFKEKRSTTLLLFQLLCYCCCCCCSFCYHYQSPRNVK